MHQDNNVARIPGRSIHDAIHVSKQLKCPQPGVSASGSDDSCDAFLEPMAVKLFTENNYDVLFARNMSR